jgi:hypothetical protein
MRDDMWSRDTLDISCCTVESWLSHKHMRDARCKSGKHKICASFVPKSSYSLQARISCPFSWHTGPIGWLIGGFNGTSLARVPTSSGIRTVRSIRKCNLAGFIGFGE